jgi:hypothetical protein
MKKLFIIFSSLCLWSTQVLAQTGTGITTLVSIGADGKLQYTPDAKGNIIPDFSAVGYKTGDVPIPAVPVVKTISAVSGDNTANIQNALNAVAAMPMNADGIRGALLLKAGTYNVNNAITIKSGGVIVRGEGNSTIVMATKASQYDLLAISGSSGATAVTSTSKQIQGSYIPVGTKSFTLPAGHGFVIGDDVFLQRKPNQAWIHMLGMDVLSQIPCDNGGCNIDWTPAAYTISYIRKVVAVNGNVITLDAPNVDVIDAQYAQGFIMKYTWSGKIENIGVESILFDSKYTNANDEAHGWNAITFSNAKNCWVTNVEGHHYGYSTVSVNESAGFISVLNCKNIDPIAQTIGGRKYSFNITGQRNLVQNCFSQNGRHDYVTGAQTAGPNVFTRSAATLQHADVGPHQRWATGILFDVLTSDFEMNAQNRLGYGTGHGWSGAQVVYWNGVAPTFKVQSPPNHMNWAIGCKGNVTDVGDLFTGDPCIHQSTGNFIKDIPSLYEKQLADRLNTTTTSNKAPTVSLTSPSSTDAFTAPASLIINATAADADGTISKVDFYNGTTLLGTSTAAPYFYTWNNVAAGSYTLTAKATDNAGALTTSSPVNVTVTSACLPASASSDDGNVATNVLDNNLATRWSANGNGQWIQLCLGTTATVNGVQIAFYNGNIRQSIFDVQVSQDAVAWTTVLTGVHSSGTSVNLETFLFAAQNAKYVRILGHGNTSTTASTSTWNSYTEVKILSGTPPVNQAPSVSIASPANNASFSTPASIAITAIAADADGTVTKVDFYNGTALLGSDATSPYSYTWTGVTGGTYTISAKATDNAGATAISSTVTVKVTAPANTCTDIATYVENNNYTAGSKVQISGMQYQCKPYPYSGWCNGAAWAYAPGTGSYWTDAWTLIGSCNASRTEADATTNELLLTNAPNPFSFFTTLNVVVTEAGEVLLQVYNKSGVLIKIIADGYMNTGTYQFNFDASSLPADMYIVKYTTSNSSLTKKIMKAE